VAKRFSEEEEAGPRPPRQPRAEAARAAAASPPATSPPATGVGGAADAVCVSCELEMEASPIPTPYLEADLLDGEELDRTAAEPLTPTRTPTLTLTPIPNPDPDPNPDLSP